MYRKPEQMVLNAYKFLGSFRIVNILQGDGSFMIINEPLLILYFYPVLRHCIYMLELPKTKHLRISSLNII